MCIPAGVKQESPAVADKPARRESMLKLLQFDDRRAYNVVADNTGLSMVSWRNDVFLIVVFKLCF